MNVRFRISRGRESRQSDFVKSFGRRLAYERLYESSPSAFEAPARPGGNLKTDSR